MVTILARYSPDPELVPRNIDVLNYHNYYLWPVYGVFDDYSNIKTEDELNCLEETRYFLKNIVSRKDVINDFGHDFMTCRHLPRSVGLYSSIDLNKMTELEQKLDKNLLDKKDELYKQLCDGTEAIIKFRDQYLPNAKYIVMGEGVTYCPSNKLFFEGHSRLYWKFFVNKQNT